MNNYALYYSQYCYFCQKVLLLLRRHQHSVELLSTSEADNYGTLIRQGGRSQVPCLRIESSDGKLQWLYESDDIIACLKQNEVLGLGIKKIC